MTTVCAISDTHLQHHSLKLPVADILIHAGDATNTSTVKELLDFISWFKNQPYQYKIFVPGNHDWSCTNIHSYGPIYSRFKDAGILMLTKDLVEIDGYKIYCASGYKGFDKAPANIDLLVTHYPPLGILDMVPAGTKYNPDLFDQHIGSLDLFKELSNINPKHHIFGHCHEQAGLFTKHKNTTFYNVGILDEYHEMIHSPRILEL